MKKRKAVKRRRRLMRAKASTKGGHPDLEKLRRKADKIKKHLHKVKNDVQSAFRLHQLTGRIKSLAQRYN